MPLRAAWSCAAAGALLLTGALALRQPIDLGEAVPLPPPVKDFKDRDDVAYPAHRWLGTALERLAYPPDAVAAQWLKAAYHARSEEEVDRSARSLAAARARARPLAALDSTLCGWTSSQERGVRQAAALERAGVRCRPAAAPGTPVQ